MEKAVLKQQIVVLRRKRRRGLRLTSDGQRSAGIRQQILLQCRKASLAVKMKKTNPQNIEN